jgi:hypothetical protein
MLEVVIADPASPSVCRQAHRTTGMDALKAANLEALCVTSYHPWPMRSPSGIA